VPRRKPKEVKPEATTPPTPPQTAPVETPVQTVEKLAEAATLPYTIKEATWEEFESFKPTPRKERPKSLTRQAFEMAASGKVVKLEGLTPAQVRAILVAINFWNSREGNPVQVKYDVKAGIIYLAPAKKPEEKKQ
jgi:predicted phage tail protein